MAAATARSMAATIFTPASPPPTGSSGRAPPRTGSSAGPGANGPPASANSEMGAIGTARPSCWARRASASRSPTTANTGRSSATRWCQLAKVISGPTPAGSPIVTASGRAKLRACDASRVAPWRPTGSSIFDVGILSDIAQMALGKHLEFFGAQVLLHLLALLFVGLDGRSGANRKQIDGTWHGAGGQYIAILGAEQQRSRRFGNAAWLDETHVLVFGAGRVLGEARHAFAAAELAPQRLGFGKALGHVGLIGAGRQGQGNLL